MLIYQEARLSNARFNKFYCINSGVTDDAATTNRLLYIFFSYALVLYFSWSVYILFTYLTVSMYRKEHWHHPVFVLAMVIKGILLIPNT